MYAGRSALLTGRTVRESGNFRRSAVNMLDFCSKISGLNTQKKDLFQKTVVCLLIGLRSRYSGTDCEYEGIRYFDNYHISGNIKIMSHGVLAQLKKISPEFTQMDAKYLVEICAHRFPLLTPVARFTNSAAEVLQRAGITPDDSLLENYANQLQQHRIPEPEIFITFAGEYNLGEMSFQNTDLQNTCWSNISLKKINLNRKNLQKVTWERIKLDGANFNGADLSGAKLLNVSIRGTNFANIIVNADTKITLNLEDSLTGESYSNSYQSDNALTAIHSIPDKTLKCGLMHQVVEYLKD